MYDVAIIGGGPAGLSAAINILARNKTCVVLSREKQFSWLSKAEKMDNHLGMQSMTGISMLEKFYDHAISAGAEIKTGRVLQILSMGSSFSIQFEQDILEAKKVIIATGVAKGKQLIGEAEYVGKGVSYCATCDGMLYRGKDVAIISDIEEGQEDANFLSEICNSVTFIPQNMEVKNVKKAEIISGKPTEVFGGEYAEGLVINGEKRNFDGIFIIKGSLPAENLVYGLETENGYIKVNRNMETNVPGVYACGDCTGWPLQVSKAIGEGQIAGQSAVRAIETELHVEG